jgi:hypothetical protein
MSDEPNNIRELFPKDYTKALDIRGTSTTVCPCGCNIWHTKVKFDEETGAIAMYFMDIECASCGTVATAPTPSEDFYEDEADEEEDSWDA